MVWLGQLFVSPLLSLCLPTCFLTRLLHEMVWLSQLFVSPLVSFCLRLAWSALCLPTCFLSRLLGWMLSRDGLARSALSLPTCSHLSPTCFLTRLLGRTLSRNGLARSALCLPTCFHLTLSQDGLARSGLCLLICFLFVSPLVSSRACWAGRCHKMVWLGRHLSSRLFSHSLAGLGAVTTWSGSVSSVSPHLFPFVSPLVSSRACWAGCCHETVWLGRLFVSHLFPSVSYLFPHTLAGLDAVTRCSGSVSSLCPHLFAFVSPLVFSLALGWMLSQDGLARSALCLPTCFLTRLLGWMLSQDGLARSALCVPTCAHLSPHLFPHTLAGLSRDGLARSALCLPACFFLSPRLFPHVLAGLDAVTAWSCSVSSLSPHLFPFDAVTRWSGAARSALCLPICFLLSPHLFPHVLAGLDAVTRWSGSVGSLSPLVSICLPTCFLTRLLGWMLSRDGLARSALCLPTCFLLSPHLFPHALAGLDCHEMVWLGQLFVSPLVSI